MIRWAVSRPAVIWAAVAAIVLGGGVSFARLPLATKTNVELPRLQISAGWAGASAELIETYVTSPIEAAIQSVRGVRRTESRSDDDQSAITVELEQTADVQIARLSILERMELLRSEFPPGVSSPTVSNFVPEELEEEPLVRLTLTGPYTPGTLQQLADERLEPRLSAVPGVAGIGIAGGTELGVSVTYDAQRLRQLEVSPQLLSDAIRGARIVRALGEERMGAAERQVVLRDQPGAIEELGDLPISGRAGRVFRLGELASIRPEEDMRGRFYRVDGQPALALSISRLPGADAIKTAAAVRAALAELESTLPTAVTVHVNNDESLDLKEQLRDLLIRGGIAFIAVLLVLALFLRDARAVTLVMLSAIVSVAGTALGLYIFDIPANLLTLAGLAMGIGILVQNGLVVAERLGTMPDTPAGRAETGRRITPAVLGATLTTMVVLFPFLYLQGDARAAFTPFATAFIMALGWSVLASVVMIPALAKGHRVHEARRPRARRLYGKLLKWMIRARYATLVLTILSLGGLTWLFVKKVPRFAWGGFGEQRTTLSASLSFPRGSDPATLDRAMRELEAVVVRQPGVDHVITQSRGPFGAGMFVSFTRAAELSAIPPQLEEALTQRAVFIGGASVFVRGQGPGFSSGFGSVSNATFRLRVLGYSFSGVERVALDLQERLEHIARVRDVNINAGSFFGGGDKAFAVTLQPDRATLARFGLTSQDLAAAVAREVRGPIGRQFLEIGGDEVPVTVKAQGALDRSLDELRAAVIPAPGNSPVRIGDVAVVSEREALGSISREDQQYVRIVSYDFRGPNKLANRTHDAFMKSTTVPAGYSVSDLGAFFRLQDDSEKGLWLVFAVGVLLVLLSVAVVFNSAWAAGMVFLSLPLALAGVMAAFWLAGAAFTREAAVGVILVVGHGVNQAILVVDAALERRRAGLRLTPIHTIAAARDRAGMILLVTLASLASLLPLAVGTRTTTLFGAIALANAGGMVAGTLGALLVLPVVFVRKQRSRAHDAVAPAPLGLV
ncbi:MAG: efflux RND transporter permease subunit [Gemmatimonadaceae bacterium]